MFIPQALLPLVAMIYALGIVQDEQEGQTITYLLIRPIPKWAFYLVKLLATVTMAIVLTAALTALTYAAIYIGGDTAGHDIPLRCLKALSIHALTVAAYCCLFGLISLLTKWTLVACILYTAVIELLLANLPFSIRLITVIYYARLIAYRSMEFLGHRGRRNGRSGLRRLAARHAHRPEFVGASATANMPDRADRRQYSLRAARRPDLLAARILRENARASVGGKRANLAAPYLSLPLRPAIMCRALELPQNAKPAATIFGSSRAPRGTCFASLKPQRGLFPKTGVGRRRRATPVCGCESPPQPQRGCIKRRSISHVVNASVRSAET